MPRRAYRGNLLPFDPTAGDDTPAYVALRRRTMRPPPCGNPARPCGYRGALRLCRRCSDKSVFRRLPITELTRRSMCVGCRIRNENPTLQDSSSICVPNPTATGSHRTDGRQPPHPLGIPSPEQETGRGWGRLSPIYRVQRLFSEDCQLGSLNDHQRIAAIRQNPTGIFHEKFPSVGTDSRWCSGLG